MSDRLLLLGAAHVHLSDHLRVAERRGLRVTALQDRDVGRRATLAGRLDARPLATLPLPEDAGLWDMALVCSETVHHEADISAALALGLPVFTEKPLAGSAAAALRLAERAERAGARLVTNYFLRCNTAVDALRARMAEGRLGRVLEARLRFAHDGGFADWLDLSGWMSDPERACMGGFGDEGVHVIDLALSMLGPLEPVALVRGHALGLGVDDHGTALLTTAAGAPVTICGGWTDAEMRLEIDIVGTRGHAKLDRGGLTLTLRDGMSERHAADPLDAGAGFDAFLDGADLAPPRAAAANDGLLDALGAR